MTKWGTSWFNSYSLWLHSFWPDADLLPPFFPPARSLAPFARSPTLPYRIDAPKKVKKVTSKDARKAKKERMARKKLGLPSEDEAEY